MKLKGDTRFPYPVLASFTDDYPSATFSLDVEPVREVTESGEVDIQGKLQPGERFLDKALAEGKLACGLYVTCEHTYFSEFFPVNPGSWKVSVGGGNLRGVVKLRAIIYVAVDRLVVPAVSIHEEFGEQDFLLNKYSLAGVSDEFEFEAGLDKLVPMESVFRLESTSSVENGLFRVGTDTQAVVIQVHPTLYESLNRVRSSGHGRQILLSALYLPCLMEVLDVASREKNDHLRWYRAIETRCRQVGVELDGRDLLRKAQVLLDCPVGKVREAVEALS
ncbi:MAG: hypothetical protein MI745_02465 [Pseudomonadales bacterium]|nr:hypothetical protein [Pseudomonadales bacterium]